jgi:hypothetical protein
MTDVKTKQKAIEAAADIYGISFSLFFFFSCLYLFFGVGETD